MRVEEILSRFDGVKNMGPKQWTAKCTCHDDNTASLCISQGKDGRTLLKCHAGCSTESIVEAINLKMKDLFVQDTDFSQKPKPKTRARVTATYPYHDANGNLLYEKLRREDKSFSQRRHDGKGGWIYNRRGVPHVLYRLHEVTKSDYIIICEGEKDADSLLRCGFVATTGENGAGHGKWLCEYTQQLVGKEVFILGDNDKVGKAYQIETANALYGKAKSVKVLDLQCAWEEIPEHGDITDFFEAVGQDKALDSIATLMHDTPEWIPQELPIETQKKEHSLAASLYNVRPSDFSDAGNATVFTEVYKDKLLYTKALGWLCWNGTMWERDEFKPIELAMDLTQAMLDDARNHYKQALLAQADATAADDEVELNEAKKAIKIEKSYLNHAKVSRNAARIRSMIELSKAAFVIAADRFDAHPFDLNTPSGIVDLLTGQIRPHDRTAYCSQITASSPSNDGVEMWNDFLNTVTCKSEPIKSFLQQVAGMAAVGAVYQEGIVMAHGGGRNGKSTLFNALGIVFGTYSGGIDVKTLTTDRQNKGASLATLRGKRLVVTGELEEHQRLSVATLKQLASTDKLIVEEKFKSPETVNQTHTLVLFTNHLPRVGSTDAGTWRRITVVPFNATIHTGIGIQNYADVLAKQAGGAIIAWIVQGAVSFIRNGFKLTIPEEIKTVTDDYRQREDWLANFLEECCNREPNARVGANELYKVYRSWAEERNEYVRRINEFTDAMEAAGFQKIAPKNKRTWVGLKTSYTDVYCGMPVSGC